MNPILILLTVVQPLPCVSLKLMHIYWIDDIALMYKTGEEKGVLTSVVVFQVF